MVHVSMIAFDNASDGNLYLDGEIVADIHANLTAGVNSTAAEVLKENSGLAFIGTQKGGKFNLRPDEATLMLKAPLNINGKSNSEIVKSWANAHDITDRPRGMSIIDFGSMPKGDAALFEMPFEYIRSHVFPKRIASNPDDKWWLHQRSRPAFRVGLKEHLRYIATPRHSKHRVFVWLDRAVLPDSALVAITRSDDYFFGALSSQAHTLWALAQGTQVRELESGFRYIPDSTFDTFPFPWPPNHEPKDDPRVQAIAAAAKNLVDLRDRWLNPPDIADADLKKRTLTNLYNNKPQWLQDAHRTLDEAVFAAYGWPSDLTDQQILERLLALNHQRAAAQQTKSADA